MKKIKGLISRASAAAVFAAALACADGVEVRVRQTPGGPMIHVDGAPVPPRFFFGVAHDASTIGHCRDAGVRFISVAAPACWESPETGDRWDALDRIFDQVIAVHPDALIVPRVHMNAPGWLLELHPDWNMQFSDGKDRQVASVCAHEYRELAATHLEKLVRHLRAKYPSNFAGVHPAGQSYGEFFYEQSLGPVLHGFEPVVRDAWREWLAARGEEGSETAEIPTTEERLSREGGMLRDPDADRRVIQFSLFEQEELADFVAALAAAARRGSDGKTLSMFFHGYGFEHTTVPNGAAATGDYGSERLLTKAAGNIDLLCAPFSYVNRKYLAPTMTQTAAESALLRGVMPLDEDDTRTCRVSQFTELELAGGWMRPAKEQTLHQLRSNLISCITRGRACWWMDLTGTGWYNDRDLWRVMEDLRPLDVAMFARKKPFSPEIAILLDEFGMMFAAAGSRVAFEPLLKCARESFERCGAPYGQYFASDAIAGQVPAKLQFFTSTFFADEPVRAAIAAQRQAQPDVTRVWCWAPGWLTNAGRDDANILKTTGFRAQRIAAALPEVQSTAAGKALGFPDTWKGIWIVDPLFSVEASDGETLARWPDGTPAVAVRKEGKGYEVFCGIPALPTKVIAGLAKLAGCQLHAAPDTAYVRAAEDKVFVEPLPAVTWPMKTLLTAPQTHDASQYATNDVQVTFFDGVPYKGKETRVFAYYGVPAHAEGEKVPAMVLVHGGGGSAFYRWVKFWNDRGYAAIAMDTCGKVSGNTIGNEQFGHYAHDWPGPPGWGSFWSMDDADEDQWVYHAVAAVIRANSFLRALPDVDPDRIGVTGVSWGGVLTCIAASLDNRFKFAAPVYGCGANFTVAPAWTNNCALLGSANVPKWKRKWDPENYLPFSTVPFHWLDGTNDPWFALPAIEGSRNALNTENGATIRVRMAHTHGPVSEEAAEIVALADHYLNDAADMPRFGPVTVASGVASATFTSDPGLAPTRAILDYTRDDPDENGLWYLRYWQSVAATISGNSVTAELPAGTKAFYLNLETSDGLRSSSHVVNFDAVRPKYVSLTQNATTKEVTVEYEMPGAATFVPTLSIETNGDSAWLPINEKALARVTGDVNRKVTAASGTIKWVPEMELPAASGEVRAVVTAWPMDDTPDYMVVSLAENAASAEDRIRYYTSTNAMPGGLLDNLEYRTSRLVLRKILAKGVTWKMGSINGVETAATGFTNEGQHNVTLDRNYYIGVFPITQAQYMWINGGWTGSWFTKERKLRIADALWYTIYQCARGPDNYPAAPSSGSTLGRLRALTGNLIDFDLPGEAEWEYVCRAGYGDNYFGNGALMQMTYESRLVDLELDKLGRYRGNQGSAWYSVWTDARDHGAEMGVTNGPPVAGSYAPNAWGLYDMLGGVQEWCLDWYQEDITGLGGDINVCLADGSKLLDGTTAGSHRVVRGGSWCGWAFYSRPAWRGSQNPGYRGDACETGMRVKCYMDLK